MVPQRPANLPWREVDGRVVILAPKTSTIHELNSVGSFLWISFDGKKDSDDLAAALVARFDVEPVIAANDAKVFFSELESLGLISILEA